MVWYSTTRILWNLQCPVCLQNYKPSDSGQLCYTIEHVSLHAVYFHFILRFLFRFRFISRIDPFSALREIHSSVYDRLSGARNHGAYFMLQLCQRTPKAPATIKHATGEHYHSPRHELTNLEISRLLTSIRLFVVPSHSLSHVQYCVVTVTAPIVQAYSSSDSSRPSSPSLQLCSARPVLQSLQTLHPSQVGPSSCSPPSAHSSEKLHANLLRSCHRSRIFCTTEKPTFAKSPLLCSTPLYTRYCHRRCRTMCPVSCHCCCCWPSHYLLPTINSAFAATPHSFSLFQLTHCGLSSSRSYPSHLSQPVRFPTPQEILSNVSPLSVQKQDLYSPNNDVFLFSSPLQVAFTCHPLVPLIFISSCSDLEQLLMFPWGSVLYFTSLTLEFSYVLCSRTVVLFLICCPI